MGGRGGLRSVEESEEDNEVDIDELIGGGEVTYSFREVEETEHVLEEEEEVVVLNTLVVISNVVNEILRLKCSVVCKKLLDWSSIIETRE